MNVRLLQISDSHCYADDNARLEWSDADISPNRSLQMLLAHLAQRVPNYAALLLTGDLAQEETAATYQRMNTLLADFPLPVYALAGNHDIPALMQTHLHGNVSMPEVVTFGAWHCLLLDTSAEGKPDGHLDEAQFARLESLLAAIAPDDFIAIFMHHHPVEIGSAWMDVMGLQQATPFWALVERFPQVKAVFHGHIHQEFSGEYAFASGRQVAVFGTPATSIQLKPVNPTFAFDHTLPAWREISLHPDGSITTLVEYLVLPENHD
jgi:Icc protein